MFLVSFQFLRCGWDHGPLPIDPLPLQLGLTPRVRVFRITSGLRGRAKCSGGFSREAELSTISVFCVLHVLFFITSIKQIRTVCIAITDLRVTVLHFDTFQWCVLIAHVESTHLILVQTGRAALVWLLPLAMWLFPGKIPSAGKILSGHVRHAADYSLTHHAITKSWLGADVRLSRKKVI